MIAPSNPNSEFFYKIQFEVILFILNCMLVWFFTLIGSSCPDATWVKRKNSCYNFGKKYMNLADAKTACSALNSGASLATIDDLEENSFLTQMSSDLVSYAGVDYWSNYYLGKH